MNEPWFNAAYYSWIPGTLLGCLGGLWGALVGTLAPRGKAKALVLGFGGFLLLAAVFLLAAGVVALVNGQPYGVWYGLGLAGLVGTGVMGPLMPTAVRVYRQAEERRMQAQDFS
jgi:hypothetical protein